MSYVGYYLVKSLINVLFIVIFTNTSDEFWALLSVQLLVQVCVRRCINCRTSTFIFRIQSFLTLLSFQLKYGVPKRYLKDFKFVSDVHLRLGRNLNGDSLTQILNECIDRCTESYDQRSNEGSDTFCVRNLEAALLSIEPGGGNVKSNNTNFFVEIQPENIPVCPPPPYGLDWRVEPISSSQPPVASETCPTVNRKRKASQDSNVYADSLLWKRRKMPGSSNEATSIANKVYRRTDPRGENPLFRRRSQPLKRHRRVTSFYVPQHLV